jgi:hypothetical protein
VKRSRIKRRTPMPKPTTGGPVWNSTLRPTSAKRDAERAERAQVRAEALWRAAYRCQAAELVPQVACRGPLDVDESASRGVAAGSHLDVELTQVLCRAHHDWRHAHPAEALALGLRRLGSSVPVRKAVPRSEAR